jgi:hypothetical protein
MNNLAATFLCLICFLINFNAHSQTYFGYQQRESESNVNYNQVGTNFNDALQKEKQERDELKKKLDDLYHDYRSTKVSNTQLTQNAFINSKIILMQKGALDRLDNINYSLRNGYLNPSDFDNRLNNVLTNYYSTNQIFLNLELYYNSKIKTIVNNSDRITFEKYFSESMNSIKKISFDVYEIRIDLEGLLYPNCNSSNLFTFISSSSEGKFNIYKEGWEKQQIEAQNRIAKEKEERERFYQEWDKARRELFQMRSTYISRLNKDDVTKFKKAEKKYVIICMKNLKQENKIPSYTKIKKEVDYWLKFENHMHEFYLLERSGNTEPLQSIIPRSIIGILYNMYKSNNK